MFEQLRDERECCGDFSRKAVTYAEDAGLLQPVDTIQFSSIGIQYFPVARYEYGKVLSLDSPAMEGT